MQIRYPYRPFIASSHARYPYVRLQVLCLGRLCMNRFRLRKLAAALSLTGMAILSSHAMASGFQLFEQDAASVGNFHAGYAAAVFDASTAFYNPAGLSRFKEQQLVVAGDNIFTSIKLAERIKSIFDTLI